MASLSPLQTAYCSYVTCLDSQVIRLISGAIGSGAERDTAEEVEAYIQGACACSVALPTVTCDTQQCPRQLYTSITRPH